MTARDMASGTGTTTTERRGRQSLAADHWAAMARTAALVRTLTALADRYDALGEDADRAALITRLRTVTAAGRLLLVTSMPAVVPAQPGTAEVSLQERVDRASSRDVRAADRDAAAQIRDEVARDRDERVRCIADDADADFPTRFLAACARDDAAGDRVAAMEDRRAAAQDRSEAALHDESFHTQVHNDSLLARLEKLAVVRQAQGVLMAREGLSAGEAFEVLLRSAAGPLSLHDVAEQVLWRPEPPAGGDAS